MKKFILILSNFLLLTNISFAQLDSIASHKPNGYDYFLDSSNVVKYVYAMANPLFVYDMMPNRISRASIVHQFEKGNFIAAQESTKTNQLALYSDGTSFIGKLKLFGAFSYRRIAEDSTRFAHQSRNNPSAPYYFGSPANNHYERTVYRFKAVAVRKYIEDKMTTGFGLNYQVGNHYAVNDPRGSVNEYQADGNFSVGYQLSPGFQLGISYLLGYGQESFNVSFKNPTYYESLQYPRYVNYLINGYSEPTPLSYAPRRKYNNLQHRQGFDITTKLVTQKAGSFFFIGKHLSELQKYDYRASDVGIEPKSEYHLNTNNIRVLWTKTFTKSELQSSLNYNDVVGKDYHITYKANNYAYAANQIDWNLRYSLNGTQFINQLCIRTNKFGEERLDGNTGTRVNFDNLQFGGSYMLTKKLRSQQYISTTIGGQYTLNLDHTFNVGSASESFFTREVIFHDYLFNTSSSAGFNLGLSYGRQVFKTMQAVIKADAHYLRKLSSEILLRNVTSTPGQDRFYSNISLNLYF